MSASTETPIRVGGARLETDRPETDRPESHRIGDEILAGYVAGALPEAFGLVVAAQASLDGATRARLDELEAIGGAVLDGCETVEMAPGSLDAVLALIADAPEPESLDAAPPPAASDDVLPAPIRAYAGGGLDAVRWRSIGMGARQAILHETGEASVRLLQIPAGCELPDHGHHGTEMTLVLQGAFRDGEQRFARGDVETADAETEHRPVAEPGQDCICLVACEGRLKFSGLLPRIAQPFIRI